jgi:hypothetical protein
MVRWNLQASEPMSGVICQLAAVQHALKARAMRCDFEQRLTKTYHRCHRLFDMGHSLNLRNGVGFGDSAGRFTRVKEF